MINARATFTSECKDSERDKQTASFIMDVLESETSFLSYDALCTILIFLCCH